jgi:glycosyltransferase involved in cell wall biosynthesis
MISVVIPLYNKAHTIERTLKSVISQTYTKFEVIIVDDGSTDKGVEILNKFKDDTRIKIIRQVNQGVSVARNVGVANANYEYIAFLDGDDDWDPNYLATINKALKKYPQAGMICCAGFFKNSKTNRTSLRLADKYRDEIKEINYFENPHVFSHTSATVVSKKVFNETDGFPIGMKKNEDYVLFFSIALLSPTVYCGIPLSFYYGQVEGQATTSNRIDSLASDLDVCKKFNLTYFIWNSLGRKNKLFKVFLKYELRHIFINILRNHDFERVQLFKVNLDKGILNLFMPLEIPLYTKQNLGKVSILYIIFTKMLWRLNGYPRVGEGKKLNKRK